ncbi:MAG TPA: TetR/AcrR family transcriptional regulator [Alphaproteobacteria bacterium]|nr:TetR/AcrR family transcriptional regulator [Alphaproteobacteria bacterium]
MNPLLEKTADAGRRTGRPTLQDASLKSERLMTVATDYFVEHGFNGATIDAIAQAADMGKQAVYTRFTDKERLFNAVIQRLREKAVFTEMPSDDGSPVAQGLPRRIRAIFEDANRPYSITVSKLAMREGRRFPELVPLMLEGTAARYTRPLAAYLEARRAAGELREIDTLEAAGMCIDLIIAEITESICTDIPISEDRLAACSSRISDFALKGMIARP